MMRAEQNTAAATAAAVRWLIKLGYPDLWGTGEFHVTTPSANRHRGIMGYEHCKNDAAIYAQYIDSEIFIRPHYYYHYFYYVFKRIAVEYIS